MTDLEKLQTHFNRSQDLLTHIKHHVIDGRGNLIARVDKLKKLGAKNSKEFDKDLLEKSLQSELQITNNAPIATYIPGVINLPSKYNITSVLVCTFDK